ncbi:hypothetical protein [Melghirimyces profundicolus]|nr:hypothetical protein [Melghirimyces profundicolus]
MSSPNAHRVEEALNKPDFLAAVDLFLSLEPAEAETPAEKSLAGAGTPG